MVACPGNLPYGLSKAAAVYMTKQIAVEYAHALPARLHPAARDSTSAFSCRHPAASNNRTLMRYLLISCVCTACSYANDLITCNAVAPGKIVKDPAHPVAPYSYARTPCARLGTPSDVASAVCWLASDEVGSYMTGHNLNMDGGWMAY